MVRYIIAFTELMLLAAVLYVIVGIIFTIATYRNEDMQKVDVVSAVIKWPFYLLGLAQRGRRNG